MWKGNRSGEKDSSAQEAGETDVTMLAMIEMLKEQQRIQVEQQRAMAAQQDSQQRMLLDMLERQKEESQQQRAEIRALLDARKAAAERSELEARVKLPKATLQKLTASDDVEHFLATFERIAKQQGWPTGVWATQTAGLITGKAMAAHAGLATKEAADYENVKAAILRRYEINEETHRTRFRQEKKKEQESHREWMVRLEERFDKWTKGQSMYVREIVILEQFTQSVPEGLRVWLRERKPGSVKEAAEMVDDYVLARKKEDKATTCSVS